jgi:putative ABC transport system permease protein
MRLPDLVRYAFRALTDRKLRAILTIIGVVIGPATIVALLGATQGFSSSITSELNRLGATTIVVTPARGATITQLTLPQIERIPNVSVVVPFYLLSGTIKVAGQTQSVQIVALNIADLRYILPGLTLQTGSTPTGDELNAADVGYYVAHPNIPGAPNISVNQVITLSIASGGGFTGFGESPSSSSTRQVSFVVKGIYAEYGQSFFIDPDEGLVVPLQEGEALTHSGDYSGVMIVAKSVQAVAQVQSDVESLLGSNYRVLAVSSVVDTITSVIGSVGSLLASIGGISLIVAFTGIMTTMFTSVTERTKEIGILKALGYTGRTIMTMFLFEAIMIGLIGGVVGVSVGSIISYFLTSLFAVRGFTAAGVGRFTRAGAPGGMGSATFGGGPTTSLRITPAITPPLILLGIGLAVGISALAGVIPAWRASRLQPAEALKSL